MFKKLCATFSMTAFMLATFATPAMAATTSTPARLPSSGQKTTAVCVKTLTTKKNNSVKAAETAYKAALVAARNQYRQALAAANDSFKTNKAVCIAAGKRIEKIRKEEKEKKLVAILSVQNNSGIAGTATVKEVGGKLKVILQVTGTPAGIIEPAHIHLGSCADLGAVKYALASLVNGKSETTLATTFAALKDDFPLAINVHKSASEPDVYVACGDIKL